MGKKVKIWKIPYGVSDFRTIRNEGLYYVDKTRYLAQMEERDRFIFFVRPRRFGKSLFISMMECYYDLNRKKDFKKLFGGLWLGSHPTRNANRFMTLKLDFSKVSGTGVELERAFDTHINSRLVEFADRYRARLGGVFARRFESLGVVERFDLIAARSRALGIPLYLIIDEYDNFTNQMIRASGVTDYREITHGAAPSSRPVPRPEDGQLRTGVQKTILTSISGTPRRNRFPARFLARTALQNAC